MEIEINKLIKRYGSKTAINDISLEIGTGMFGLLGPNGAGKTTLMRILTCLVPKTDGYVSVAGIPVENKKAVRAVTGYLPQDFSIYPGMTVYEAMDYLAILSDIKPKAFRKARILELLEKVNLESSLKTRVKALSGGMKRRLGIAQALLNDPRVLIVDEPTAGLDPEERVRFRNLLCDFASGRIVILSTHIVEDVEFTCEKLAVLKEGSLVYAGKVNSLVSQAEGFIWTAAAAREELDALKRSSLVISAVSEGDQVKLRLLSAQKPFEGAERAAPGIEDAYMKLMKGV